MNEKNVQIIEKDGRPEYAVLPFEDYRRLIDLLDDNADCTAIDHALREDEAGDTIPGEIVNAILDGVTPLRGMATAPRVHAGYAGGSDRRLEGISFTDREWSKVRNSRYIPPTLDRFRRGVG